MDAIRMIKKDHRKVESLFEQFETLIGLPSESRTRLIDEICEELMVHTTIEEELLYPEARRVLDTEMGDHAEKEHDEADQLIVRVRACDPLGTEIEEPMQTLRQRVLRHIQEEESTFLPQMERSCGDEALDALGSQLEARRQQLESAQRPVEQAASTMATAGRGAASGALIDLTKEELYEQAQQADIPGRSKMTKSELVEALTGKS